MNNLSKFNYLVIDSKEEPILFQLGDQNGIKYTFLDKSYEPIESKNLYKDNVLKFSIAIDKMDKIHLVSLMRSGELNYSIFENGNWSSEKIDNFDFRSKIYSDINILIKDDNINIIYGHANLINSKLWTINHIAGNHQSWNKQNVIKFASDRTSVPFVVDMDPSGSIQLLYRSVEGDSSQIYHTFYNHYLKEWNSNPRKLTSMNSNRLFPYIFADNKNNLHALWLEELDKNYVLKYSKLTLTKNKKHSWNQIQVPYISNCNNTPILFEEKGILKIIYPQSNNIGYIYSLDYGNTWSKGETFDFNPSEVNLVKISNLSLLAKDIKINDIYCSIQERLNFFFLDSLPPSSTLSTDDHSSNVKDNLEQDINKKNKVKSLDVEIDKLFETQKEIKNILYENLDSQNKIERKLDYILKKLETKRNSLLDKFFK